MEHRLRGTYHGEPLESRVGRGLAGRVCRDHREQQDHSVLLLVDDPASAHCVGMKPETERWVCRICRGADPKKEKEEETEKNCVIFVYTPFRDSCLVCLVLCGRRRSKNQRTEGLWRLTGSRVRA